MKPSIEETPISPDETQVTETNPAKKEFIEPEITAPVDVLEATTFFQTTTSGVLP